MIFSTKDCAQLTGQRLRTWLVCGYLCGLVRENMRRWKTLLNGPQEPSFAQHSRCTHVPGGNSVSLYRLEDNGLIDLSGRLGCGDFHLDHQACPNAERLAIRAAERTYDETSCPSRLANYRAVWRVCMVSSVKSDRTWSKCSDAYCSDAEHRNCRLRGGQG